MLWSGAMNAEGTKGQTEFISSDIRMLDIIFQGLERIFDMSSVDPHYDILIGENLHHAAHRELNEPIEPKFSEYVDINTKGVEKVTRCQNSHVIDSFKGEALTKYPLISSMRFYRLRVDRIGKKSIMRVEINCKGTTTKFVWGLARGIFFDLDNFMIRFAGGSSKARQTTVS